MEQNSKMFEFEYDSKMIHKMITIDEVTTRILTTFLKFRSLGDAI